MSQSIVQTELRFTESAGGIEGDARRAHEVRASQITPKEAGALKTHLIEPRPPWKTGRMRNSFPEVRDQSELRHCRRGTPGAFEFGPGPSYTTSFTIVPGDL
jgi:hypothetical protein